MGNDPIINTKTGKVVGSCWSKECSAGCGKDSIDLLIEDKRLCRKCWACPDCCTCQEQ